MLFSSDAAGVLPPLGPLQNDPGAPPSSAINAALVTPAPAGTQTSPPQEATTTQDRQASGQELAFVDMSVDGAQEIVDGLRAEQSAGRTIEIIQIQAGEDGLRVITETLARYQDVQAVHVFSHGDDQGLTIGTARLDAATLPAHMQDIASWSAAMATDGDLLLYGCNLAGSSAGQALVNDLALLSGADVAASTNLTGGAALGGDWVLEYQTGSIETLNANAGDTLTNWQHTLATVSFQDGVNGYTGTTDTYLDLLSPTANNASSTTLSAGRATTQNGFQTLLKFENIFGNGAGQIPQGAIITGVTLEIYMTASPTFTNPTFSVYRMLASWSDTASWTSMGSGVDGSEALSTADMTIKDNGTGPYSYNFTTANSAMIQTLQAWADDPSSNQGWYIFANDNSSKASFASSEHGTVAYRPKLTVEYTMPTPPSIDLNTSTGGTGHSGAFTEGTAVNITNGNATITAGSTNNLNGMSVTLNNRPNGTSELLAATTTGTNITASYNSSTGVLTLSGTDTLSNYQQVLRSITYNNTSDNPSTTARTLTVTITDTYNQTASATSTITVTAVNDAPTASTTGSSLGYTENDGAVVVDSGVVVNDVDGTNLTGATVRFTNNYVNGQDLLSFLTQNGITGVWDASTGTLTLTGTATVAQYQAALRSITYTNNSDNPSTAARTVSFTVTDGALTSTAATRNIAITAVNDAPVVTTTGGSSSFTENGSAVAVDSGLTVSDVDSTNLNGATVRITGNYSNGQDLLSFTDQNGISGSWNASTGTLTLSGTATLAQYQTALRSITYSNSSENPSTTARTVSFTVTDSSSTASNTATRTAGVTAVNDAPVITSNGGGASASISVGENSTAVTTVTATDVDSSNLVYSIVGGSDASRFTIDSTTGVLRFVTAPNFEAPLDAGGNNVYDVIVQVSDGALTDTQALAVTVTDVNEFNVGPVSDANGAANSVAENAANGSTVGITAQASDADGSNNTVTYTLSDNAGGRFTINATTGVVTVANGTLLNYEAATSHSITVVATSGDGSTSSQSFTINLTDVNEFAVGPVSDVNAAANTVAENAANGSTVGITARAVDADGSNNTITYTLSDNAGGRFTINASTGVVTLADGSLLDFETATSHSITVLATSSDGSTNSQSFTVNVTDVNEFPVGAVTDTNATANQVAENAANGTTVGITARATDADASNNTVTYTLSDNAGGRFTINATTGVVTVANGTLLNYEAATSHTITVAATSSDGSTNSQNFTINITDVDEFNVGPVTDANAAPNTVAENATNGSTVGITAQASDADGSNNTITYTLSDNAGGRFTINASTGVVTVADGSLLDFETATAHNITVLATSSDGSSSSRSFTIAVSDVNEHAVGVISDVDTSPDEVNENASNGDEVGITARAIDADGTNNTVTYTLSDNAGGRFTIDAATGVVTVLDASLLDFEAATSHSITVLATSSDGSTSSQVFTIATTDGSEAGVGPVSDVDASPNTVMESAANGTTVGITASAIDPDVIDTVSYSLSNNAGGRFTIDATTGVVTVANGSLLDREAAASHNITVVATSTDGSSTSRTFTISLIDQNEFAVGTVTDINPAANQVSEDAGDGTLVGITARATDADATNNTVTYTLSDNAGGRFTINTTTGVVTVADSALLDYESASSHSITVLATSSDGSTSNQSFTINLIDVNEYDVGAVSDIDATPDQVAENATNGSTVGITARAVDADGTNNTVTYTLSDDAGGRFTINATTGVVTVLDGSKLDFEAANSHDITVVATSSDGSTSTQTFTIDISDVSEFAVGAVTDTNATANQVAENAANGTAVGITAHAVDLDGSNNTATYTLSDNAGGRFTIDSTTGVVTVADGSLLDFEAATSHSITVVATSSDGTSSSQSFTINLTDVNEHAVGAVNDVNAAPNQAAENATNGSTVGIIAQAADADGTNNTITYSLYDDAGGRFTINATTGVVTVADGSLLDFETATSHTITVLATSSDGSTNSQSFTVNVTDVNEFPVGAVTDTNATANQVAENAANGTTVGITARATDADASNNTVTYTLSDNAGGRFTINASTGVVTVANGTLLDFESATSHSITVVAASSDGSISSQSFVINVSDVNEHAVGAISDTNASANQVAENATNGSLAGITAHAVDADGTNNTVTYSLSQDAGGRFAIDASTGVVRVLNGALLDREAAASHTITVLATSSDGSTSTQSFTIDLLDVDEFSVGAVSDSDATPNQVAENAANGTTVGITAHAVDLDTTNNAVTYTLSNNAGGRFAIDAATGVVTVANGTLLDFESATSHTITVVATGTDGATSTQSFTIGITDVNEHAVGPVSDTNASANQVAENTANGSLVDITAQAVDADGTNNTITYTLSDNAGGRFTINASTGVVTVANGALLDYESASSHSITVVATSSDGSTSSQSFTIALTDRNDAPTAQLPIGLSAVEQVPLALQGQGLVVADVDAGTGQVRVTLSVVSGALNAAAGSTGVLVSGSGTTTLTLTGTIAQINALFDGLQGATLGYLIDTDLPPPSDTLTLVVNDQGHSGPGGALTATASTSIAITDGYDAPTVVDHGWSMPFGTPLRMASAQLLQNAQAPELRPLTPQLVQGPSQGTLSLQADGSWLYTPRAGFSGSDSFTYLADDGMGQSNIATVRLTVQAPAGSGLGPTLPTGPATGPTTPTLPIVTPPTTGTPGQGGTGSEGGGDNGGPSTTTPTTPGGGGGQQDTSTAGPETPGDPTRPSPGPGGRPGMDIGPELSRDHTPYGPARFFSMGLAGPNAAQGWQDAAFQSVHAMVPGLTTAAPLQGGNLLLAPVNIALSGDTPVHIASALGRLAATATTDLPALLDLAPTTLQTTGTVLSVGAVWWAARGATLLTSLLVTTPVWRNMDPLPVLSTGADPDTQDGEDDDTMDAAAHAEAELIFEEPRVAELIYPDIA
ncbi:MAG: cadherin domain-containing protein [Aquabacterium sp.]|uniref:cadherin domain-containing protein n=1 Tax=Aquabacterium sp. TaxID=1872578 RepID=UPI003BB0457B